MKPLETARQLFPWICAGAIDHQPLTKHQVLSRQIFRFALRFICAAFIVATNANLLLNYTSMVNDMNELFFGLFQFDLNLDAISTFASILVSGSKLASLFPSLERIYDSCKNALWAQFHRKLTKNLHFLKNSRSG